MDTETIDFVQSVIDTGLVGVVLVQSIILYRALTAMTDRYIAHLERISERMATLATPPAVPVFLDERADAARAPSDNVTI